MSDNDTPVVDGVYQTQVFSGSMRFKPSLGEGPYYVEITGHRTIRPHVKIAHKMGALATINVTVYAHEARAYAKMLLEAADLADPEGASRKKIDTKLR